MRQQLRTSALGIHASAEINSSLMFRITAQHNTACAHAIYITSLLHYPLLHDFYPQTDYMCMSTFCIYHMCNV